MRIFPGKPMLTLALLSVLAAACSEPVELPPLPEVDTGRVLPAVRAQMDGARAALVKTPRDAQKNGDYAMVLHAYDRSEDAFVLYERARRLAPKDPRWPYYQSAVLLRLGQPDKSLAALDEALRLAPGHVDVMAMRGEALFLLSRLDEAERQLGEVVAQKPSYPLAQFYLARLHIEKQEWQQAADKFEDLLSRGLNVRDLHQNLGVALRMLGQTDKAREHLDVAARGQGLVIKAFDPINMVIAKLNVGDQPHLMKASELYARRDLEAAKRELEMALEKNPDSLGAHLHLVRIFAEQADVEAARRHYEKVMAIEPTNATAHASWALALSQGGQNQLALQGYRKAVAADPREPQYHIAIANVLGRMSRYEEALVDVDEALRLAPDNRNAIYLRASSLLALGRADEALAAFEPMRRPEDRRTPMVLRGIAIAQHTLGQPDKAQEELAAAVALARKQDNPQLVRYLENEQRRLSGAPAAE